MLHAKNNDIPILLIEKERFYNGDAYLPELKHFNISWIVLAGFLWKVPSLLIQNFKGHIINIHPALLPKYGGKGMYGHAVHEAVIKSKDVQSGITIHYVDEQYDHGETILQVTCPVLKNDTAESLASKIHELEHEHFAPTIEKLLLKK